MVMMATPWRHPKTGTYYLRRQIPLPLRGEFGGRQLWKRSLDTKNADEARRLFPALNSELEQLFERAREVIARRSSAARITVVSAAEAVARASARHRGSRFDRFPVLANLWPSEQAASSLVGGRKIGILVHGSHAEVAEMDPSNLPGDAWLQVIRTRSRSDALQMAEHMIHWVIGDEDRVAKSYIRNAADDTLLVDAITEAIEAEQADLRKLMRSPLRPIATRLRPDMTLHELLAAWKTKTPAPGAQGAHETGTTIDDFVDFAGDLAVSHITGNHLYNFRDAVASLPKAMPKADRELTFTTRLAKYGQSTGQMVAPASVKRRVGHLQSLLTYAFNQRWIEANPGAGIRIEGYAKNNGSRRPFLDDELRKLFSSALFLKPEQWTWSRETVSDRTLAWLFLLGLTNGARIEEIGQTDLANIKTDGGVRYLDLGADARVKNEISRRMIPLHSLILRLGFDNYVAALRAAGETRLFPELKPNKFDKLCQAASRVANRAIDRIVSDDPRISFHSLRHNFKDLARDATIEKYIMDQITGHSGVTTGDRYGIGARLKTLSRELNRVEFEMIDWDPIVRSFETIDWGKMA